ncbi:glycosyltransferase family 4 protein [Synechococcus sp. PCC 7336]|uniref:glycosyltransferase family 4 protein n=1 Tax=Synechococcus sp. PCC 7336 TaxID=195250 RepID=UPI001D0D3C44|nr:glycosyltransferase family 4 protein [Synechococcus sp. PCC 7336]
MSTPVGPLGSGIGGGVELNILNLARALLRHGDRVHILAPANSQIEGIPHTTVPGQPPTFAQARGRNTPVELPLPSTLANLWELARRMAPDFDAIVNWAYDWLPFYLTPWFDRPIAHIVSMGSLNDGLDAAITSVRQTFPNTVAVHSRAQAATFPDLADAPFRILPCGIDLSNYQFISHPTAQLCWVGRIAPEKGLEDCAALSQKLGLPVAVLGRMQDPDYWQRIVETYPGAQLDYRGFLATEQMQAEVGRARALVATPKWTEAFGMVVVEAMACGVPAIVYDRGGPAEIVASGETGWVVQPDRIDALAAAVGQLDRIDRRACRARVEQHYSLAAMQRQFSQWMREIAAPSPIAEQ